MSSCFSHRFDIFPIGLFQTDLTACTICTSLPRAVSRLLSLLSIINIVLYLPLPGFSLKLVLVLLYLQQPWGSISRTSFSKSGMFLPPPSLRPSLPLFPKCVPIIWQYITKPPSGRRRQLRRCLRPFSKNSKWRHAFAPPPPGDALPRARPFERGSQARDQNLSRSVGYSTTFGILWIFSI